MQYRPGSYRDLATDKQIFRASWAVFGVFVLAGMGYASWLSRLPAIRDTLGLDPIEMAHIILLGALGSFMALPLSGFVTQWLSSRRGIAIAGATQIICMLAAVNGAQRHSVAQLVFFLFIALFAGSLLDGMMNIEAGKVECLVGKAILPRYHGAYSIGTVIAALLGAGAAALGLTLTQHLAVVVVINLALLAVSLHYMFSTETSVAISSLSREIALESMREREEQRERKKGREILVSERKRDVFRGWLEPKTIAIGFVVMCGGLLEGAGNDWISLAAVDDLHMQESAAAIMLGLFTASMTLSRLTGPRWLNKWGRVPVLRVAGAIAVGGVVLFGFAPGTYLPALGVIMWGVGAALTFPVGMSKASDDPARAALRLPVVHTVGYVAFLVGPTLLGYIAQHVGYRHSLIYLLVPATIAFLMAGIMRPAPKANPPKVAHTL